VSAPGVVIVGAAVGGVTTAETLRELGYDGAITLVGDEPHPPYNRPPLSKQVLAGDWEPEDAVIASRERLDELGIDLVAGRAATGVRLADRVVEVGADDIPFDSLVVATGVAARAFAGATPRGVHTLRTWDDALRIRAAAASAGRVLVVGSGVLGSELASGLSKSGASVTLVGRSVDLRLGQVGTLLSPHLAALHRAHGVELRLGVDVVELLGSPHVSSARLSDGSVIGADLVVVAIGSLPRTGWLGGALSTADGILCDSRGHATADVYAIGDVARWERPDLGRSIRVEHQQNAIDQARLVAHEIVGIPAPEEPIRPFFWTELYGSRIQAYGDFDVAELEVVAGEVAEGRFVAAAVDGSRIVGAVGWNHPRAFRDLRAHVDAQTLLPTLTDPLPALNERQPTP
jgi:NADPH-dependent 2,4-dienoyl-CoA reductase/sulfur reductase-like enzyme